MQRWPHRRLSVRALSLGQQRKNGDAISCTGKPWSPLKEGDEGDGLAVSPDHSLSALKYGSIAERAKWSEETARFDESVVNKDEGNVMFYGGEHRSHISCSPFPYCFALTQIKKTTTGRLHDSARPRDS